MKNILVTIATIIVGTMLMIGEHVIEIMFPEPVYEVTEVRVDSVNGVVSDHTWIVSDTSGLNKIEDNFLTITRIR